MIVELLDISELSDANFSIRDERLNVEELLWNVVNGQTPEIKPWGAMAFLGNGLYGGLIGASIDIYTGAPLDPSHNGELVQLKPATGLAAVTGADFIRLRAAAEGCSPEKAAYAREIGVPCEALSQRVDFDPAPQQTTSR